MKEVGLLFLGIFITMMPALAYLGEHGRELGIDSATKLTGLSLRETASGNRNPHHSWHWWMPPDSR